MADPAANSLPSETWWIAALAVGLLVATMWWLIRRQRRAPSTGAAIVEWEERARVAEGRATQAETVVRAGLLPHLARLLRARFVVRVLHQRSQLIETQQEGTQRIEDLEERLASAHANLEETLASYERQIEALQKPSSAPVQPGTSSPPTPASSVAPTAPLRKNPLVVRPPRPEPEPLRFGEILARRKPASPDGPPADPPG